MRTTFLISRALPFVFSLSSLLAQAGEPFNRNAWNLRGDAEFRSDLGANPALRLTAARALQVGAAWLRSPARLRRAIPARAPDKK